MISLETLMIIFIFIELTLFISILTLTILIFTKKKYKLSFLSAHLAFAMVIVLSMYIILSTGKIVGYSGGDSIINISSMDEYGDKYKVKLDSGFVYYADYAVYGEKTRLLHNTTAIRKTVLGIYTTEETSILMIKDKNIDFDKMSKSELSNYVTEMRIE